MATATKESKGRAKGKAGEKAGEKTSEQPTQDTDGRLWLGKDIRIILVSGEIGSGKTLFSLMADPNTRRPEIKPTTICWDQEGSAETYRDSFKFEHRDMGMLLGSQEFNRRKQFELWMQDMQDVEPGAYRVGIVDTGGDLEAGLVEYVRSNPKLFGKTRDQFDKMATVHLWPCVKAFWNKLLYTDIRERFETFIICLHMKNEWRGSTKTGRRIAEGLDVLSKLATLHIHLTRGANKTIPTGEVIKERLIVASPDGEIKPILPPVIPQCTADAIRGYIRNPPNFERLKAGEKALKHEMTDEDRLSMEAQIATSNEEAAKAQLERAQVVERIRQMGSEPETPETPETPEASATATDNGSPYGEDLAKPCSPELASRIRLMFQHLQFPIDRAKAVISDAGAETIGELTGEQALELLHTLEAVDQRNQASKRF